jgi:serine/threonine protein kinase
MQSIISAVLKQIQALASPSVTKKYKLEGTIGKGNFSIVKRATDRDTGREVAIKVIGMDRLKSKDKVNQLSFQVLSEK